MAAIQKASHRTLNSSDALGARQKQDSAGTAVAPLETQRERRRAQFVGVTAQLIVAEGVDGVTHAAVADAAGCTRPLVYHYFPSRQDLLHAVVAEYASKHTRRITTDEAAAGVRALASARKGPIPATALQLSERSWAPDEWNRDALQLRLATLILVTDRDVAALLTREDNIPRLSEAQLSEPLLELGLSAHEVAVVRDTMLAGYYRATAGVLAGDMSPDEAVAFTYRVNRAAVQMFLP